MRKLKNSKILSPELEKLYQKLKQVRFSKKIFKEQATDIQKDDSHYVEVKKNLAQAKKLLQNYLESSNPITPHLYKTHAEELQVHSDKFRKFQQRERVSYNESKNSFELCKQKEKKILEEIFVQKEKEFFAVDRVQEEIPQEDLDLSHFFEENSNKSENFSFQEPNFGLSEIFGNLSLESPLDISQILEVVQTASTLL